MQIHGFGCVKKGRMCYLCATHQKQGVTSNLHLRIGAYQTNNLLSCARGSSTHVLFLIMTVLLKNLFTVHFQFDLLKLETNNTRDDILKHAWIIVRWTVGYWNFSLTTVATSWVEPHSVWPPSMQYERAPTTLPHLPPTPLEDQDSTETIQNNHKARVTAIRWSWSAMHVRSHCP